jgi:4-aminobutyrate aminotransferase-like enzyme
VNGNWAPHLHIQLLTHMLDRGCNIEGVAAPSMLDVWESISPDPNLILGIPEGCRTSLRRDQNELLQERRLYLSSALSLSYAEPLHIVRGGGQYLYDEQGRAYLDMVNNVCHVGHCHPRVVRAGQEQMARLNTNTRYLYDALTEYVRRLMATFPEPLGVCFLVNSGSEANDLALRLARAHTSNDGIVVIDHAYHGHASSLIGISPYKFNGPGGAGCPPHVRVCEMPDGYRGPFKYADPAGGRRYAEDVERQILSLEQGGQRLAAFFAESAISCGGQIILPPGYLDEAYRHVRAAGGVCVADEVQVGLGRVGTHVWAFETQGVVPDIVTLGKPLGNGHPLAAVITTPEIAASFETGMEYFNTFGGNPVSVAIGLAVLDVIRDERLRQNALRMGSRLIDGLRALAERSSLIGDARGLGLFIGVELVRDSNTLEPADAEAKLVIEKAKERGVLLSIDGPYQNVLKIKPPMAMAEEHCEMFLSVLDEVLGDVEEGDEGVGSRE